MAPADSCKQAEVRTPCWLVWYDDGVFRCFVSLSQCWEMINKVYTAALAGALDLFLSVFCSKGCIMNSFLPIAGLDIHFSSISIKDKSSLSKAAWCFRVFSYIFRANAPTSLLRLMFSYDQRILLQLLLQMSEV